MFLILFHLSVFALNSFTLWYDQMYVDLPFPSEEIAAFPLKARLLFLTVWCLILQTVYFFVSFLNDVFGTDARSPQKPPFIRRLKDIMFSLSFTVALYVSAAFWGLYAIHKDLILPEEIEAALPPWVNHVMHTLIAPFIIIELFATQKNYPSKSFGIKITVVFISMYIIWINLIYFNVGDWVYPFMAKLNWPQRFGFYVLSTVAALAAYATGEKLNILVSPSVKVYANGLNGVNGDRKKQIIKLS